MPAPSPPMADRHAASVAASASVPVAPRSTVTIASPPAPTVVDRGWGHSLLGGLGSLGMVGFALVGGSRVFLVVAIAVSVLGFGGSLLVTGAARRRAAARARTTRDRWRAHLADQVASVAAASAQRLADLERAHSTGVGLLARARAPSVPVAAPARTVLLGRGRVPAPVLLVRAEASDPLVERDRELFEEADVAVDAARFLVDAPVTHTLNAGSVLVLVGPLPATRGVARSLVAHLLTAAPAGDLGVAVQTAEPAAWHWLVWAPHAVSLGSGPDCFLVCEDDGETTVPVPQAGASGGLLLLTERPQRAPAGATVIDLHSLPVRLPDGQVLLAPAQLSLEAAEHVTRALAPRRLSTGEADRTSTLRMLGIGDPAGVDVAARWEQPGALRAPVGRCDNDLPVWLDLREAAAGGHGPHGLLIGATGSGKSELLRSLVLALALGCPPDRLAFVLVDWKGGAAFDDVSALPHVAGLITNLHERPGEVTRVAASLRAELDRRQRLLRAGGAESVAVLRARGAGCPPDLIVVIDEFGELLSAEPDVIDVLAACGRLGRSLGIHLLLSSQRLDEGRLRGLEAHLRYRICLRVLSSADSVAVLGNAAAAELPPAPGWGLLAVDGETTRFRAVHSSHPLAPPDDGVLVRPLRLAATRQPTAGPGPDAWVDGARGALHAAAGGRETERAAVLRRVASCDRPRTPPVWLAPLPNVVPVAGQALAGSWDIPLGIVDDIAGQAQPTWRLDLAQAGHLAVVAGPGFGASTAVACLTAAITAAHPPRDVQVLVLQFGGADSRFYEALPHLRCLAGPAQPELARAALEDVVRALSRRDEIARSRGLAGAAAWRSARSAGQLDDLPPEEQADLLVIVDGVGRAREQVEDLDDLMATIAAAGLRVCVRLGVTAQRWADLRPGLRELVGTRLEMPLADPGESLLPRHLGQLLAGGPPGRVVTPSGLLGQFAQPSGGPTGSAWPPARRLRALPVSLAPGPMGRFGVRAGDHAPVAWDYRGHLLVLGDARSGRTSLLRRVAWAGSLDPFNRRVTLVDPRRSLRVLQARAGIAWTSGGTDTERAVAELVSTAEERRAAGGLSAGPEGVDELPTSPSTAGDRRAAGGFPAELEAVGMVAHTNRWWSGPEHLLVIDDADLLPGAGYGGALAPLADILRAAPDLGIHIVVARAVTGLARSGFDPFTATVRETAATTVLLRGDPAEGPLALGLRARPDAPTGRASWIVGNTVTDVQLARCDPSDLSAATASASVPGVDGRPTPDECRTVA